MPYMAPEPSKRRDRYDVTGNIEAEYVDADQTVLVNKKGITDLAQLQTLEEEGLANAYGALLSQVRVDTLLTSELTRYVHREIFGELYEWAGRWRTVNISKPGITWPPPAYLDENMTGFEREVLAKFPASALGTDQTSCDAVAQIQGEYLVIHPFREGTLGPARGTVAPRRRRGGAGGPRPGLGARGSGLGDARRSDRGAMWDGRPHDRFHRAARAASGCRRADRRRAGSDRPW